MWVDTSTKVGELCFKCSQESQWRCKLRAKVLILTDHKFSKQKSRERNCFYTVLIQFTPLHRCCHYSIMLQRYKYLYQQALPDFLRSAVSRDLCEWCCWNQLIVSCMWTLCTHWDVLLIFHKGLLENMIEKELKYYYFFISDPYLAEPNRQCCQ